MGDIEVNMDYQRLKFKLDDSVTDDDLDVYKSYCNGIIGKRRLEEIKRGIHLLDDLETWGKISSDNVTFLRDMFEVTKTMRQLEIIKTYENTPGTNTVIPTQQSSNGEMSEELSNAKDYLADRLGRDWKKALRSIGLKEHDFDKIAMKCPNDLEQQIHCGIDLWFSKEKENATLDRLIQGLRSCQLNSHAKNVGAFKQSASDQS